MYLAKYATKSTEVTGHTSTRMTEELIAVYADRHGTHTERLVDACWRLAHARWRCPAELCRHHHTCPACVERHAAAASDEPSPYARLRQWAHMLGFGGHFLTKSRRYSITFGLLRDNRVVYRRTQKAGPEQADAATEPTTLVVNFLQFVGAGWRTPADAMLANTSAAMAREHADAASEHLTALAA